MRIFLFAVCVTFFCSACNTNNTQEDKSKSRIETFAKKIETDLKKGRTVVLDLNFDKATFVNRVVNDKYWDEQLDILKNRTYKPEYKAQLMQQVSLANMFLTGLDKKSYFAYDHVKTYEIEGRWHIVFRMYANEALNYHDFLLRIDSNKVWIEDMYVMAVGRQLSKIMQEIYVAGIPSANGDKRWSDHQKLIKTKELLYQQQFEKALAVFDSITPDFKNQKSMRLFRLQICANVPNEEYIRQIESYERDYPNDAGTLLLQLDKNFMSGNYPEVKVGLNRLESMYGKDAIIDYMRGNANNLLGNCEEAGIHYKSSLQSKPDWEMPFVNWADCLLKESKYEETINLIEENKEAFGLTPVYVKYLFSDYPNFINSTLFKTWEKESVL